MDDPFPALVEALEVARTTYFDRERQWVNAGVEVCIANFTSRLKHVREAQARGETPQTALSFESVLAVLESCKVRNAQPTMGAFIEGLRIALIDALATFEHLDCDCPVLMAKAPDNAQSKNHRDDCTCGGVWTMRRYLAAVLEIDTTSTDWRKHLTRLPAPTDRETHAGD